MVKSSLEVAKLARSNDDFTIHTVTVFLHTLKM